MKTKVLIYCTKAKPFIAYETHMGEYLTYKTKKELGQHGNLATPNDNVCALQDYGVLTNGHILAECEVECEEIKNQGIGIVDIYETSFDEEKLLCRSCLTHNELHSYLKGKNGYALHISNLKVIDEELILINRAPQNMMWVWYKGERYCLISIRPEWVCKILNGEKTIEVRKKVLKGMYEETL